MFWELPVKRSPKVKGPMFNVLEVGAVRVKALNPLETSKDPENELEPVLLEVMMPPRVRVDDIEAVPPTSKTELMELPALMPKVGEVPFSLKSSVKEWLAAVSAMNLPEI